MSGNRMLVLSEQLLHEDSGIPPTLARVVESLPGAEVLRSAEVPGGTRADLLAAARRRHADQVYDAVICQGFSLAYALASDPAFAGRLWPFIDDAPGEDKLPFPGVRSKLGQIAGTSRFLLAADEDERSLLESFVPESAGKVLIPGTAAFDAVVSPAPAPAGPARRILLAGHDLKFTGELVNHLEADPGCRLVIDQWTSLHTHDEAASQRALADADTVICEWAGGNAVWYSHRVRPEQRLIIRLHGFEVRGDWLKDINIDAVDTVVLVSEFFRSQVLAATGWPREKTLVIPNMVDAADFLRPKESGAEFRLGLAGMVPWFKRPDRALDILAALLDLDDRYSLHIRSRYPWEYDWFWNGRVGNRKPTGSSLPACRPIPGCARAWPSKSSARTWPHGSGASGSAFLPATAKRFIWHLWRQRRRALCPCCWNGRGRRISLTRAGSSAPPLTQPHSSMPPPWIRAPGSGKALRRCSWRARMTPRRCCPGGPGCWKRRA
ncbi:hypothetical protein OL239_06910 [Arthrobacter sp. ATA002]|uniref:hypothetical protein n=1 Tax=Arthrobacter sp. ATA002 TaxID=2991715 RepID=UPI0022A783BB|nr:hypothetical protein [Arthrobacter sp. ATA002]WAP52876.1 hypothetical protein OL239_06910 [Arthrobacter sp. ATA002]